MTFSALSGAALRREKGRRQGGVKRGKPCSLGGGICFGESRDRLVGLLLVTAEDRRERA